MSVSYGMGMHIYELQPPQITLAVKWIWVMQTVQILSYGLSKAAVVAFLLELQGPTYYRMRWFLIFLAATNVNISCFAIGFRILINK